MRMVFHQLEDCLLNRANCTSSGISMSAPKSKKRFQFSLRTLLLTLACVSAYLVVVAALPRIALPALPIAAFVAISVFMLRDPPQTVAIGSCVLISVSTWTIGFVVISALKILPGSFGPVQYAEGNMLAMFVFNLRIATILVMFVSPIICSLIGAIRLSMGMRVRQDWLAFGIGSYLIAWIVLFWNLWFFPTV